MNHLRSNGNNLDKKLWEFELKIKGCILDIFMDMFTEFDSWLNIRNKKKIRMNDKSKILNVHL